jgi:hypothetical protein
LMVAPGACLCLTSDDCRWGRATQIGEGAVCRRTTQIGEGAVCRGIGGGKGEGDAVFFQQGAADWVVDAEGAGPRRTREASGGRRGMKARGGTAGGEAIKFPGGRRRGVGRWGPNDDNNSFFLAVGYVRHDDKLPYNTLQYLCAISWFRQGFTHSPSDHSFLWCKL